MAVRSVGRVDVRKVGGRELVETAVVAGARASREEAFDRLIDRELAPAYRTAAVLLGDWNEAEDAVQDALEKAWQHWGRLRDDDRAGAWFGRILVNVCRDRLRSRSGRIVQTLPDPPGPDPSNVAGEREAIFGALGSLNPDQRVVIVLRFYLDLSLEAIAERTGSPLGTVKSRLHHALLALRAAYDAQERIPETKR